MYPDDQEQEWLKIRTRSLWKTAENSFCKYIRINDIISTIKLLTVWHIQAFYQ